MATIDGTNGNDTIRTAATGGSLNGLPNATDDGDTINGFGGNDVIIGGAGNDVINGFSGNDTIRGGAGNDTLNTGATITGNEFLYGEAGDDTLIAGVNQNGFFTYLFGGPGNDTIEVTPGGQQNTTFADYADRPLPIVADLIAGTVTVDLGGGLVETDTLINVRGIRASTGNDTLLGSSGDDFLLPGLGTNVIDGRGGFDSLRYMDIIGGVVIDMAAGTAFKPADGSTDTFTNIEAVSGTNENDTLRGDAADNDLRPLAGNDLIDGRGGYDTVGYQTNFSGGASTFSPVGNFPLTIGIVANLTTGIIIDPWGGTDTLISIERIVGTTVADDMTGAVLADGTRTQLRGIQGNDIYRAPAQDTNVTVDYRGDPTGVLVNLSDSEQVLGGVTLAANTARDGYGGTDSFVDIQAVRGSNNGDVILGTARADVLEGEGGNDTLLGGAGDDRLRGGAGDDTLDGGDDDDSLGGGGGTDTYRGGDGYDWINFESDGTPMQGVVASLTTGLITDPFGNAETIPDNDIEMLIGTSRGDDLEGKARDGYPTLLSGRGGDDTLRAGNGGPKQVAADYRDDVDANGDGIGIIADLYLPESQVLDTYGDTDTLVGVHSIRGSNFDDSIVANAEANWLSGEDGADVFTYIDGSHVEGDEIDGGEGFDTIVVIGLLESDSAVYDLSALSCQNVEGIGLLFDVDLLMTAEQFAAVDVVLSVSGKASLGLTTDGTLDASGGKVAGIGLFKGSAGDDTIITTDAGEEIAGQAGDDTIDGGAGTDTAVFAGNRADYAVSVSGTTVTVTDLTPATDGDEGTDTLANVELFRFRDGTFTLAQLLPPDPVNVAPVAVADVFVGDEDTVISGNVLANDTDADGDTLTAVLVSGPANGAVTLNADGSFSYTPNANAAGEDSFTYRAGDGALASAVTTVSLTVAPVNDAPVAADDAASTPFQTPLVLPVAALLANDSDIDGPALAITAVGDAVGGSVSLSAGIVTFTPASGFSGSASFVYTLGDGSLTDTASVAVTVGAAPPPPPPALGFTFTNGSVNSGEAPSGEPVSDGVAVGAIAETLVIESVQNWNNPKNSFTGPAAWTPDVGNDVAVVNFVDARVDFSNALGVDLDIAMIGIKRGTLMLADGDDTAHVVFHSNEGTWNNTMTVSAGAGDDAVTATAVSLSGLDEQYLADNANPGNGAFWNRNYDGRFSVLDVDLGEGNDSVTATNVRLIAKSGAGDDTLVGGIRNDVLDGGAGTDIYTGGAGRDTFILRAGEAMDDVITDVAAGDVVRLLGFGPGASLVAGPGGSYTIESGGAAVGSFFAAGGLVVGTDVLFA